METDQLIFYILQIVSLLIYGLMFFTSFAIVEKQSFSGKLTYDPLSTCIKYISSRVLFKSLSDDIKLGRLQSFFMGTFLLLISLLIISMFNVFVAKLIAIPFDFFYEFKYF